MNTTRRKCTRCLEEKPITEFNFKDKRRGRRQIYCRDCTREQVRMHYHANLDYYIRKAHKRKTIGKREECERIRNYLQLHPCIDCGEADLCCLDYDHVRGKKRYYVSRMIGKGHSWETILNEISKCEVRCANCHRKRHAKRRWLAVFTPL
jgi:hypothetical protein